VGSPPGQAGVLPRKLGQLKTLAREPVESLIFGGPGGEAPPAGTLDRLPGYVRHKTGSDALGDSQSTSAGDTLTIKDNRLLNPDPPILAQIPYKETPTVDELLDSIRRSLTSPPKVPDPGSYGRQWILYSNGHYFHEMGRRWAQFVDGKQLDRRPLREVGINPGMTLEIQPPKQAILVVNPRPFLGAGVETLQFVYSELRDVGGFINRIQNWIPELSVESYGTRWVLYDPATGRYFDDIVKGDSRVLWTAGIANEDGDTFLDVRPPQHRQVEQANVLRRWSGLKTELKVAIIAGLFAIVVAIVTGIFNLGVAHYNGSKVISTPTPASPTSTPTGTGIPNSLAKLYEDRNGVVFSSPQTTVSSQDGLLQAEIFKAGGLKLLVKDGGYETDDEYPISDAIGGVFSPDSKNIAIFNSNKVAISAIGVSSAMNLPNLKKPPTVFTIASGILDLKFEGNEKLVVTGPNGKVTKCNLKGEEIK
jgi:hypothetical protein